jgi:hypothetical protein
LRIAGLISEIEELIEIEENACLFYNKKYVDTETKINRYEELIKGKDPEAQFSSLTMHHKKLLCKELYQLLALKIIESQPDRTSDEKNKIDSFNQQFKEFDAEYTKQLASIDFEEFKKNDSPRYMDIEKQKKEVFQKIILKYLPTTCFLATIDMSDLKHLSPRKNLRDILAKIWLVFPINKIKKIILPDYYTNEALKDILSDLEINQDTIVEYC